MVHMKYNDLIFFFYKNACAMYKLQFSKTITWS